MRKLLLVLCVALSTTPLYAQRVFVSPNKGGGEITLTDRPCIVRGKTIEDAFEAYTWTPSAPYEKGCWSIVDGMVHVLYLTSNERRVYSIDTFREKK